MKNKKRKRKEKRRWFRVFFAASATLLLGTLCFSVAVAGDLSPTMDEALFQNTARDRRTIFYADGAEGEAYLPVEWEEAELSLGERCLPVSIEEMPEYLPLAFVAMEDHRFYRHGGVDLLRTFKAAFARVFGKGNFGGSTITQQLIKNIGGERERTAVRKYREILRAHALEAHHSKDEILEAYLNIVPMSEGCVGVEAAARAYFGKHASELTLAEAASLCAITPAPARYNPRKNAKAHLARRNRVLARMAELGYITEEERLQAEGEPLSLSVQKKRADATLSWYFEYALKEVKAGLLKKGYTESTANALLYGGGLRIYTALDPKAQTAAEQALVNNGLPNAEDDELHGGAVVFSPVTGKLVALVGDLGEKRAGGLYSYATDMRRAPGSALKPLALYAPAIEEGVITEATLFDDVPKSFDTGAWPHNTPDRYDGLILAKDALATSKNTVAVELFRRLGTEHVYATLREKFRIEGLCRRTVDAEGRVRTDLAEAPLALGELTYGVSLFELARAYLPFCMEGEITRGSCLYRVENSEGEVLFSAEDARETVLSEPAASVMTHMLCGVVNEGSAKTLTLSDIVDTAGKTGSSGGNRDRWFVGYTPHYLCGVWCGYEKGGKAVEGVPHLRLFDAIMKPLHEKKAEGSLRSFQRASGLSEVTVCKDSGKMQTVVCKEDVRGERSTVVWLPAQMHLSACDTHVSVFYDDLLDGVAYPPAKGREGSLRRVSLLHIPWRSFPVEVVVTDAEYVWRDPMGHEAPTADAPFFAGAIPEGVYIGKSHDGRPFNAAARALPPLISEQESQEETQKRLLPRRTFPKLPRRRLPRFSFFGF